nr:porin [Paraburkholderia sp. Ac-20340]
MGSRRKVRGGAGWVVAATCMVAGPCAHAEVTLYGNLDVSVDNFRTWGAPSGNIKSTTAMTSNISDIGMRGSEDLGDGVKAIFQINGIVDVNSGSGSLVDGDSYVGLSSASYGQLTLGRGHTPLMRSTVLLDPFGDGWYGAVAAYDNIIGSSQGLTGGGGYPWDVVQSNAIQYQTPTVYGAAGWLYVGFSNSTTAKTVSVVSAAVNYLSNGLYLSYAFEQHNGWLLGEGVGFTTPATSSTDTDHRIGMGYRFGSNQLSAIVERMSYEQNHNESLNHWSMLLGYLRFVGPHVFRASYIKAWSESGRPDSGAQQFALGYGYNLSKRTQVYTAISYLDNQKQANYNPLSMILNGAYTPAGGRAMLYSVGIHHDF